MSRKNAIKSLKNIPCKGYLLFLYSLQSGRTSQATRQDMQKVLEKQTMYTRFKGFHIVPLYDDNQYAQIKKELEAVSVEGWIERTYIPLSKSDFDKIDFTER